MYGSKVVAYLTLLFLLTIRAFKMNFQYRLSVIILKSQKYNNISHILQSYKNKTYFYIGGICTASNCNHGLFNEAARAFAA